MGLLNLFKAGTKGPSPLPTGSFTVDRTGEIISSTVSTSFPLENLKEIAAPILLAFQSAAQADCSFSELAITLGAMTIKARELRGGAIVFLSSRGGTTKN